MFLLGCKFQPSAHRRFLMLGSCFPGDELNLVDLDLPFSLEFGRECPAFHELFSQQRDPFMALWLGDLVFDTQTSAFPLKEVLTEMAQGSTIPS